MNSNLNPVSPCTILIMTHWNHHPTVVKDQYQSKHTQSWCDTWEPQSKFPLNHDSKVSLWWPLQTLNSNTNPVLLIIIFIMTHWNSLGAMICNNRCKHTQFWCDTCQPQTKYPLNHDSKVSLWWPLQTMNSNINHVLPIIIFIMTHWNSLGAMICNNRCKHTQSWCES